MSGSKGTPWAMSSARALFASVGCIGCGSGGDSKLLERLLAPDVIRFDVGMGRGTRNNEIQHMRPSRVVFIRHLRIFVFTAHFCATFVQKGTIGSGATPITNEPLAFTVPLP